MACQRLAGHRQSVIQCVQPPCACFARHPGLDPARIDDVYFGDANAAGEDNRNVARMATLLAGLPISVPGATVNRLCGSGMEAVAMRYVLQGQESKALEAAPVLIDMVQKTFA